jgi:hypothetical protein
MNTRKSHAFIAFICFNVFIINNLSAQILKSAINDSADNQAEKPFRIEEKAPEFPGGIPEMFKFLSATIRYPALSRKHKAEGTAYIGFVVNTDGTLEDVQEKSLRKIPASSQEKQDKIPEEAYQELVKEAIRVVKLMPKWKAGEQNGRVKKVSFTLPIKFKLS